jgi:hypothetical protein
MSERRILRKTIWYYTAARAIQPCKIVLINNPTNDSLLAITVLKILLDSVSLSYITLKWSIVELYKA